MAAEPNAQTRPAMMRQYADVLERTASEPWPADSAVDMVARHGQRTIALCLRSGADAKEALARLQTAHATQSAELQAMREERDRCCDDYQREAQRAVEAEHRITALQAQLAEARGAITVLEFQAGETARETREGIVALLYELKRTNPVAALAVLEAIQKLHPDPQREPSEAKEEGGGDV